MNRNFWLVAVSGLALSGCGGLSSLVNGGGNSGTVPTSTVRANLAGDTFSYVVTGNYTVNGVESTVSSGTASELWTSDTYSSQAAIQDSITTVIQIPSGQQTFVDTRQFTTALVTLGQTDNGTMYGVTAGAFTLPSTLAAGNTVNGVETLSDGTTVTVASSVTGYATIATQAGSFPCWTITKTLTWSDGLTQSFTIDFSPVLGAAVQETVINTYTAGISDTLTYSLTSDTLG